MIETKRELIDVFQTGAEMRRIVELYWSDLGRWLDLNFLTYFNFVCALPYRADPNDTETVSRPIYLLKENYSPRDCDDKSVLIASWMHGNGIMCKFTAISTQPDGEPCHVFTTLENGLDVDATYPEYHGMLGNYPYYKDVTNRVDLTEWF